MGCTMRKIMDTRNPVSNTIKDTPPYIIQAKGLCMIVLISSSIAKGFSTIVGMVHPIPTSPLNFIQLNDFCTCIIL